MTDSKRRTTDQDSEDPNQSDDLVFTIASHAWKDGLTANTIARKLKLDIMTVKRALAKAHRRNVMKLIPPSVSSLETDLSQRFGFDQRHYVTVAKDRYAGEIAVNPASLAAAHKLVEIIEAQMHDATKSNEHQVVLSNSGGFALASAIQLLPRAVDAEVRSKSDRIISLAHNRAGSARAFHRSSSFLAVRLAEILGGEHMAVSGHMNTHEQRDYRKIAANIGCHFSGVGTIDGLLGRHLEEHSSTLPTGAVGDFSFIPLDINVGVVNDTSIQYTKTVEYLGIILSIDALKMIHQRGRIICVLDDPVPSKKKHIALAALRSRLATDYILGARLAKLVLRQH